MCYTAACGWRVLRLMEGALLPHPWVVGVKRGS
jgi:hypothetical protein